MNGIKGVEAISDSLILWIKSAGLNQDHYLSEFSGQIQGLAKRAYPEAQMGKGRG